MNPRAMAVPAAAGFIMGIALPVAGVTRPEVITGWLDLAGAWNPTLFFFFLPATLVFHGVFRWARAREGAGGPKLKAPATTRVDARLIGGAALFGVGWALLGSCPGPALATLGNGEPWAALFVIAMLAGLYLGGLRSPPLAEVRWVLDRADRHVDAQPGEHQPHAHQKNEEEGRLREPRSISPQRGV